MSNELVLVPQLDTSVANVSDQDFDALATVGSRWPRIQVMTSNTNFVKEGKIGLGTWAMIRGQTPEDIGKEIQIIPLCYRPTAIDVAQTIILHDQKSNEFQKILELSKVHPTGYMAGNEFLCYFVDQRICVSFYAASKSAKVCARSVKEYLGKLTLFGVEYIKKTQYSWHAPTVKPCSTPLDHELDINALHEEMGKFMNPKEVEVVEEASPGREV